MTMNYFKKLIKTASRMNKKTTKRARKKTRQTGKTNIFYDKKYKAKKPGRRISKNGNVYYEYRANRSDIDKRKRI